MTDAPNAETTENASAAGRLAAAGSTATPTPAEADPSGTTHIYDRPLGFVRVEGGYAVHEMEGTIYVGEPKAGPDSLESILVTFDVLGYKASYVRERRRLAVKIAALPVLQWAALEVLSSGWINEGDVPEGMRQRLERLDAATSAGLDAVTDAHMARDRHSHEAALR